MELTLIFASTFLVIGGLFRFWQTHSCSICHRIHYHENEFLHCEECGKRFCANRISRHEKIIENISGVLGNTTRTIDTREINFRDFPCGFEFITTVHHGVSTSDFYCTIHKSGRRRLGRPIAASIANIRQRPTLQVRSREIVPLREHRRKIEQGLHITEAQKIVRTRRIEILPYTKTYPRRLPDKPTIVINKRDKKWK